MTWPIRRRLSVAAAGFTALLVALIGLVALTEAWRRSNAEYLGDESLELAIDRVDRELGAADAVDLRDLSDSDNQFVALFDEDAFLLDATPGVDRSALEEFAFDQLDTPSLEEFEIRFDAFVDDDEWDAAAVLCSDRDRCHGLVLGRRPASWLEFVSGRLLWGLGGLLLVSSVAGLGARWLIGRSLRPVDDMRRELDAITDTDTGRRISVPRTQDELAALGTSLNATVDRLAASVAGQRQFVSDAAHELRSPLTGLRATLELASADPERAPAAVSEGIAEVDRATALIDDLLDLARRQGGLPARRRLADIDDLVRIELQQLEARWPGVQIQRGAVQPVQARVDVSGVVRVVRNLLDNAAAHAETTVVASLMTSSGAWTFMVEDDGPGVPASSRREIFQRFRRLDEARGRHTGGAGLGLAIVAEVVAAHGGTVAIDDAALGGARFTVRVPT